MNTPSSTLPEDKDEKRLRENIESSLMGDLEAIMEEAQKINEGDDGVICHMNSSRLKEYHPQLYAHLFGEAELPDDNALKILKIYRPGAAAHEYKAQKMAHEVLEKHPGAAKVPKPYYFRDHTIGSSALKEKIMGDFGVETAPERVEFIIMDLIQGQDLAEYLIKAVAHRHPKCRPTSVDLYGITQNVARALQFSGDPLIRMLLDLSRRYVII